MPSALSTAVAPAGSDKRISKWTVGAWLLSDDLAKLMERNRIQEELMAEGLNRVQIIGNLAADPEMRFTANGKAVTSFRIGSSRSFNGKQETEWFSCVAWEKLGELVAQHLEKGRQAYIEGRLTTRSWEKDGVKHYKTEVTADKVLFLGGGNKPVSSFDPDIDPDDLPFEN